jgi:hypothetical protein
LIIQVGAGQSYPHLVFALEFLLPRLKAEGFLPFPFVNNELRLGREYIYSSQTAFLRIRHLSRVLGFVGLASAARKSVQHRSRRGRPDSRASVFIFEGHLHNRVTDVHESISQISMPNRLALFRLLRYIFCECIKSFDRKGGRSLKSSPHFVFTASPATSHRRTF